MNLKKTMTCLLAAAIATGGVVSGVGTNYSYLRTGLVSAAVSAPAESTVLKETAYVTWDAVSGADGYNVYVKPEGGSYTQIDSMLIRQYNGYFRADAVGLKAGKYVMKVVPTSGGAEDTSKAIESAAMTVGSYDRSGYAFANGSNLGAYNADGTLKSDAIVVYVTNENKDTVTCELNAEGKGNVTCTGVQNIITAYKKGKETRPMAIRFIGNIEDPANMPKGDLLLDTVTAGMTIEGIGNDATFNGFGLVLKNCSNVEVRNIGFMNCNSSEGDDCGLQQGNTYCWVHNCDFFYGDAGSDADQAKGDGALDTKKSQYITHSYNHFFDNGKCNLQGANSSDTSNYITYHHNWYDHSDSRHPRVRVATVHVYNNYYDGNAKYGIGSTTDSDVFVENNYFRNCKTPMIISEQGSDTEGTLSSETGGMIKAFGNVIEGAKNYIPYSENNTNFDCYDASSKTEQVPSSVKAVNGGATYNNFDTASDMYSYELDSTADIPAIVEAEAGRLDGGDFKWEFDDSVDDESYAVNAELKAALVSYNDSIVAIGSGFKEGGETVDPTEPSTEPTDAPTTTVTTVTNKPATTTTTTKVTVPTEIVGDAIYCSPDATSSGKGTKDSPIDVKSAISMVKAGGTIYLLGGTYKFSEQLLIEESNSGTADAMKTIMAYPGDSVVFDFSGQGEANSSVRGIVLDGSYWHFYGFELTKAADNGMLLSGDNNKIEMMVFNDNQDTGLQLSRYQTSYSTVAQWPSNNLVLNCTSKNNCDNATMENADGFAAKLTCGEGNVFDGCMAYNNSDDGWDLYAKTETGPIGVVTIKNSVAFRNGYTEFGEGYGDCDGNGFKLGGAGVGSPHIVENCLAFENLNCGFTDNNNPDLAVMKDCTAYNNGVGGKGKANVMAYRCSNGCDFENVMSFYFTDKVSDTGATGIKVANDKFYGTINNSVYYNSKNYYVSGSASATGSSIKEGDIVTLADTDFISLSVPAMGSDFHTAWRNADGSVNTAGFAETTGTYEAIGYHFAEAPTVPIVTTPATTSTTPTTTTTITTTVVTTTEKTPETTNPVTTEKAPETTQTPTEVLPEATMYGDVNLDGEVNVADIVSLNMYLLNNEANPITEQAKANADCLKDNAINTSDSGLLMNYVAMMITADQLGKN